MSKNYFDNPNNDETRKQRAKAKKKTSFGKWVLIAIAMLIIAFAAFVITLKIISPDFDVMSLVPQNIVSIISPNGESPSATVILPGDKQETKPAVTAPEAEPVLDYLPIEDFKMNEGKKGNQLGNILNGGLVATDMTYDYHIVKGEGIYRIIPSTESFTRIYKSSDNLSSLNLRGDYLYFVNERDNGFYRLKKSSQSAEKLADNAKLAYIYDNKAYYITTDNTLKVYNLENKKERELYSSADEDMLLIGVSLKRVFFSVEDIGGGYRFMSVDIKGEEKAAKFRTASDSGEILCPVMENGFLYYYSRRSDGSYALERQKYGSENAVVLEENVSVSGVYPITDTNRVFYAALDDKNKYSMIEQNMNNGKKKTMLRLVSVEKDNSLVIQHGGVYDFVIGSKGGSGKKVYAASSVNTGSTNIMKFTDGNWSY